MLTFLEIEQGIKNSPALLDPVDSRDFKLEDFAGFPPLPLTFSLRDKMTPVKNQGTRGSCVGFASTAICEFFNSEEQNRTLDLSEEYLFKRCKEIDLTDYGFGGYGSHIRSGAKALNQFGTCLENTLIYSPYESEDFWKTVVLTNEMNEEALPNRMLAYASVETTIEALKAALVTTKSPVLCAVMLYKSYRQSQTTGFIPMPVENEERIGGHAMALVGYTETHFIFKNSWGLWGDAGYIYWPFEAVKYMYSCWSFVDLVLSGPEFERKLIEENLKQVPSWALPAWRKAITKGIVTGSSKPAALMSKAEMMVFFDRLNLL